MCLPFVWFYCRVFVQACFEYVSEKINVVHSSWSFVIESLSLSVPFLCVGITREPQLYFTKRQLDFGELPLGMSSHFHFKSKPNTTSAIPPIHITSVVSYNPPKLVIWGELFEDFAESCNVLENLCLSAQNIIIIIIIICRELFKTRLKVLYMDIYNHSTTTHKTEALAKWWPNIFQQSEWGKEKLPIKKKP